MKSLLATLTILTLTTNINNVLDLTYQKNNISTNNVATKTQQATKYIDQSGNEVTTNETNLANIITKEITQIGFYQNQDQEVQAIIMPHTIEKVPNQLPPTITNTNFMFANCLIFNQNISSWNTSNVTNMSFMFFNAEKFNQDLSQWNTSHVTDMTLMFYHALSFNGNISQWNVEQVTTMFNMFFEAKKFNQDLSQWNTSNVIYMDGMFENAITFNQNISLWNTSKVKDMTNMFKNAITFNQDLSQWNVEQVINHKDFNSNSGFEHVPSKLPKFKR